MGLVGSYVSLSIYISGIISLPYAEIEEPFEAWLDLTAKSSRIDYYHGEKPPSADSPEADSVFPCLANQ